MGLICGGRMELVFEDITDPCGLEEVIACEPRASFRAAFDVPGATLLDALPDDAVAAHARDAGSAVLALSHEPTIDDLALEEALGADCFHVGALGSARSHAKRRGRLVGLGPDRRGPRARHSRSGAARRRDGRRAVRSAGCRYRAIVDGRPHRINAMENRSSRDVDRSPLRGAGLARCAFCALLLLHAAGCQRAVGSSEDDSPAESSSPIAGVWDATIEVGTARFVSAVDLRTPGTWSVYAEATGDPGNGPVGQTADMSDCWVGQHHELEHLGGDDYRLATMGGEVYEVGLRIVDAALEQSMMHPGLKEIVTLSYPRHEDPESVLSNVCRLG